MTASKSPEHGQPDVTAALAPLQGRPDLVSRLERFLDDGTFPEALEELAAWADAQDIPKEFEHGRGLRRLFRQPGAGDDLEFLFRLSLVCEAARPAQATTASPLPGWLGILFHEKQWADNWPRDHDGCSSCIPLHADLVEEFLQRRGESPVLLVRAALAPTNTREQHTTPLEWFLHLAGFADRLTAHPEAVRRALEHPSAASRTGALELIRRLKLSPQPYLAAIVDAAVCPQATVRASAEPVLKGVAEALPLLEAKAREGKRAEQEYAASLLGRLDPTRLSSPSKDGVPAPRAWAHPPPLSRKAEAALRKMLPLVAMPTVDHARKTASTELTPEVVDRIVQGVQHERTIKRLPAWIAPDVPLPPALLRFLERPDVQVFHVVRLLEALGHPLMGVWAIYPDFVSQCLRAGGRSCDIRELAAAVEGLGVGPTDLGRMVLSLGLHTWGWEEQEIWPWFAEHLEILHDALVPPPPTRPGWMPMEYAPEGALAVLRGFPTLPEGLVPLLFQQALGGPASTRSCFQETLANLPGLAGLVQEKLRSGQASERTVATEWLGRIGGEGTVEALRHVGAHDRSVTVRSAALAALERLGVRPETPRTAEDLVREAQEGLRRHPRTLAQPLASAVGHRLRWADGERAPGEVATWIVTRACALRSPEPDRWLLDTVDLLHAEDRCRLAARLLEAWLSPPKRARLSPEEARSQAEQRAREAAPGKVPRQADIAFYLARLPKAQKRPNQDDGGVLAVVAAFGDAETVERARSHVPRRRPAQRQPSVGLPPLLAWLQDQVAGSFSPEAGTE